MTPVRHLRLVLTIIVLASELVIGGATSPRKKLALNAWPWTEVAHLCATSLSPSESLLLQVAPLGTGTQYGSRQDFVDMVKTCSGVGVRVSVAPDEVVDVLSNEGTARVMDGRRPSSPNRTVVFMRKETIPNQDLFLRGGIDINHRPGCTNVAATDPCALGIATHLLGTIDTYEKYNAWRVNDQHLDWHGPEPSQGVYQGRLAVGTPMAWTSSNLLSPAYQELNTFGDHYWMLDMEMDCSQTENGWFDFKGFLTNDAIAWEADIIQSFACSGDVGGFVPYVALNHMGRCGYLNVFEYGKDACEINSFPY